LNPQRQQIVSPSNEPASAGATIGVIVLLATWTLVLMFLGTCSNLVNQPPADKTTEQR
jgi:hypothetical protein